jgi:hypothetical protein
MRYCAETDEDFPSTWAEDEYGYAECAKLPVGTINNACDAMDAACREGRHQRILNGHCVWCRKAAA